MTYSISLRQSLREDLYLALIRIQKNMSTIMHYLNYYVDN